jgi:phosphohistidine swiveling domain-containing protein
MKMKGSLLMNAKDPVNISNRTLILKLNSSDATLELVGGKGASLARLARAGLPVPPGFHITTHAYRRFVDENHLTNSILSVATQARTDDPASLDTASAQIHSLIIQATIPNDIADFIRQSYAELGADDPPVAVRSSATAEDLPEMSFAGQQETYLNVRGNDHVLDAVKRCWASLWTARAIGCRAKNNIPPEDVALAVVVQRLVPADAAGILFTANPMTGDRDQMVINAAWGLGEAIVGGQVTPDTFIVNKQTTTIASQEIADKQVMTVRTSEGTREEPVTAERRKQSTLNPDQVFELSRLGIQIEGLYARPMDIEWAMQDGRFFILQARPITALPEPHVALNWKLPRPNGKYMRANIIELLPDPLSPLFATLGLPAWDEARHNLGKSVGINFADFMPEQLYLTINDYAYLDYGFSTRQSWRYLLFVPRAIKRLFPMAQKRWAEEARPHYVAVVDKWAAHDLSTISSTQLLDGAREIVRLAAEHYLAIQSGILPMSKISESLFPLVYDRLIKRKDDPPALAFMLGFDSVPIQAEKSLYDLAMWAREHSELADYLARATSVEVVSAYQSSSMPIHDSESWREFSRRFGEHLNRFGHAIYDLDFAKSVPADDPAPLLETLKYFLAGGGRNPYERQAETTFAREQATQSILARLKGFRLRWFTRLLQWVQDYTPLREDALAGVGLGWPLLRSMLREIGRRLADSHAIAKPDDVFWLNVNELENAANALDTNQATQDFRGVVTERRARWERERMVTPPVNLPIKGDTRFWGIDWSFVMPARTDQAVSNTIKGIGASPGRIVGIARLIHGPNEFKQMQPNDILITKITTPAWTPLFALASGIVTDVGGLLSHSSIVAREYHIPAVLGTGVATERIHSGQRVIVDGDSGVVAIER